MNDLTPDLQIALAAAAQREHVPGATLHLNLANQTLSLTHGIANLHTHQPMPHNPRFLIYSITKTITAIALLKLHANGTLNIDQPAQDLLPQAPLHKEITLTHLLNHTSGLPDYVLLPEYLQAVRHQRTPWTDSQFAEKTLHNGTLFPPGKGWSYSNLGYMFLRQALTTATKKSFRKSVEELVTSPLGMHQTQIAETPEDLQNLTPGYSTEIGDPKTKTLLDIRPHYHPDWCAPGVAASTTTDITSLYNALFEGKALEPNLLKRMLTLTKVPGHHPPTITPSAGMGILADPNDPLGPSYGHGGGGPGYSLQATTFPNFNHTKKRLTLALCCNTSTITQQQRNQIERDVLQTLAHEMHRFS